MAGGAAAWIALPAPLRGETPPNRPVIGTGEHTYECYHDWLVPPPSIMWGDTHGLAIDRHGHIYVTHTVNSKSVGSDAILVFDHKGKFVRSFGAQFRGGGHGLDIRKEGSEEFLYHCDVNHRRVTKLTLDGKVVWDEGVPTQSGVYPSENRWNPTNVAFHPDGDIYVGDGYGSSYVHRYTIDGVWKEIVLRPGREPGLVNCPHGLWVDTRQAEPKLVVCDRENNRLQEFDLTGKLLGVVKDGMRRPCHIHYNHGLALVPDLSSLVTILDKDNKVVAALGDGAGEPELRDVPREKFIPGKFIHPHAAIWINKTDIVLAEWVPIGRITMLKRVS